jgi:O-antigen/teichoic acid export membrane protein
MVFIEAWQFSAVSESDEKERADFFTEVFAAYQGLMFMAASALVLFAKVATLILLDKSYYDSWQYIPPLALAMVFSGLVTFMGSVYLVKKKSVMSFVTAMIGAVVNVALNVLLIPVLSAMGAAIATFVSYFVVMIIRSVNTQKYVRFNMGIPKLVFNTAVLAAQSVVMVLEIKYWIAVEAVLFAAIVAVNGKDMLKGILSALKNIGKKQKNI